MKTFLDCIPCLIRQTLDAVRIATDDPSIHEYLMRRALALAVDLDMSQSPPAMAQQIHRMIKSHIGQRDLYIEEKQRFNEFALKCYPELKLKVNSSKNPFYTALRVAIAGNIIDLGAKSSLSKLEVEQTIKQCLNDDFDDSQVRALQQAISKADRILYLTDNAGEIVFDRLFIEQMPMEKITVAVKGQPIINDATMEDAQAAGLTDLVKTIDNGSDAPGTILESCSPSFISHFERADLVISKGQGNYESLSHVNKNIFFILKAKCPVIAADLGCELGAMILRHNNIETITEYFDVADIETGIHPDGFKIDKTAPPIDRYTKWDVANDKWDNCKPVCFHSLPQKGWVKMNSLDRNSIS